MEDRFANGCAWIDGEYIPFAEARIPIADTGFTRADATYDVVAVWNGRFFRLDAHLKRFERSYRGLRLRPKQSLEEMREILFGCVRRSGLRDAYVDMIVTRGGGNPANRDFRTFENPFYAYAIPYVWIAKPEKQEKGVHLVVAQDTVRISPQAVDPTIKNFHWGDLVRGAYEAFDRGGELVVLPDAAGILTEGPGFNIFAVSEGTVWTPARGALEGITRRTALELAEAEGIPTRVEGFDGDFLRAADEAFITSTAGGVIPATIVDGRAVGSGVPGPITTTLRQRYWSAHDDPRWSEAVDY
jgi:branched-chain amino acid aminotransferase